MKGYRQYGLALAFGALGRQSDADRALAALENQTTRTAGPGTIASCICLACKQLDRAFAWLDPRVPPALMAGCPSIKSGTRGVQEPRNLNPRYKALLAEVEAAGSRRCCNVFPAGAIISVPLTSCAPSARCQCLIRSGMIRALFHLKLAASPAPKRCEAMIPGSATASRVLVSGVTPETIFRWTSFRLEYGELKRKVRDRETPIANTRDACANPKTGQVGGCPILIDRT